MECSLELSTVPLGALYVLRSWTGAKRHADNPIWAAVGAIVQSEIDCREDRGPARPAAIIFPAAGPELFAAVWMESYIMASGLQASVQENEWMRDANPGIASAAAMAAVAARLAVGIASTMLHATTALVMEHAPEPEEVPAGVN